MLRERERFVSELHSIELALAGNGQLDLYPFAVVGKRVRVLGGPGEACGLADRDGAGVEFAVGHEGDDFLAIRQGERHADDRALVFDGGDTPGRAAIRALKPA